MRCKKVLLVGKVPPPVGGVTVFVSRLMAKLRSDGCDVDLFPDKMKISRLLYNLVLKKYDSIIFNTMDLRALALIYLFGCIRIVQLIDHNHSRHLNNSIRGKLTFFFIARVNKLSLVSAHLINNYPDNFRDYLVIDPFLPPSSGQLSTAHKNTPCELISFAQGFDKVLIISAWRYIFERGEDLYGLGPAISVFNDLSLEMDDICLIICIGDISYNEEQVNILKQKIADSNIIYLWENCSNAWSLFSEQTIYLRPTSTDGNSISVYEALHFGARVLASDVVPRPDGCVTYKYSDVDDFKKQLRVLLQNETNPTKYR